MSFSRLESLSDFVTRNSLNDGNPAINIGYRPRFRKLVDLECDIIEQTYRKAHEDLSGLLL
jgi:hypothetical protein